MYNKSSKIFAVFFIMLISFLFFLLIYIDVFDKEDSTSAEIQSVQDREINFCFVGDILLSSNVERLINNNSPSYPFENVRSILSSNDFVIGNLENPISTNGSILIRKQYNFRALPNVVEGLKSSGFNILSLANNHIMDYGATAMEDTINTLKENDIYCTGAGNTLTEAKTPVIVEKDGKKIAFISAGRVLESPSLHAKEDRPGVFQAYYPEELLQTIKETSDSADFVIVYIHWGKERALYPEEYQQSLAKDMIDNGADLIVGSHPHVLQGFEYYNNKLIAYSLGNFVFTDIKKDSIILRIKLNKDNTYSSEIIPCMINLYRPEPLVDSDSLNTFYNLINKRSFNISIDNGKLVQNTPEY